MLNYFGVQVHVALINVSLLCTRDAAHTCYYDLKHELIQLMGYLKDKHSSEMRPSSKCDNRVEVCTLGFTHDLSCKSI